MEIHKYSFEAFLLLINLVIHYQEKNNTMKAPSIFIKSNQLF
jgi:hypothetical protein